jgi:uncharacterized protein YciI
MAVQRVLFYDYVGDILERRGPYREEHLARIAAAHGAGTIAAAGALGDPPPDDVGEAQSGEAGSRAGFKPTRGMFVFAAGAEPAEVEAFALGDPYVREGLVTEWRVQLWNVVT